MATKSKLAQALDLFVKFAEAHEKWEAALILSDEAWDGGMAALPTFTHDLYDEFMEVQRLRNTALDMVRGK